MTHPDPAPADEPYGRFAGAYASGAERQFSEAMSRFVLSRCCAEPYSDLSVLDVACGIGAACEYFASAGLHTTGVDASSDMLERAASSAQRLSLPIQYLRQDMRRVTLPALVDLVTCMYDSLNFMDTAEDLGRAFAAARSALRTGGLYVFDMYTVRGLEMAWGARDEIHTDHPAFFVATRTSWDPTTAVSTKTFWGFDKVDGSWRRWSEQHTSRAYPLAHVAGSLKVAGFDVEEMFDWRGHAPGPVSDSTDRVVCVARAV